MEAAESSKITNMIRRRITGIVIAVVMVVLWFFQGWPMRVGLVALMVMAMWEMYGAFVVRGAKPIRWVGMAYALLALPVYLRLGVSALTPLTTLFCMLALAGVIFRGRIDFDSAVATLFPLFYPGMLITMLFPLQDLKPVLVARVATALMLLIPLMTDLFAYEFGTRFGRRKLSPALSPNKSVEGSVAGVLAAMPSPWRCLGRAADDDPYPDSRALCRGPSAAVGVCAVGAGGLRRRPDRRSDGVDGQALLRHQGLRRDFSRPRRHAGPNGQRAVLRRGSLRIFHVYSG
jgi:dolichol kinase